MKSAFSEYGGCGGKKKCAGCMLNGSALVSETNYNEEMKMYSIRGKLFAIIGKNINNRLAVSKW